MSLYELLRRNARQFTVVHETNVRNGWNPPMCGRVIDDHAAGRLDRVRAALRRKRRAIAWHPTPTYIETSHSFLKSYWDLAPEFFPHTRVFHWIRNPLEVARSESNRELWMIENGLYRWYRGDDGGRYKRFALTELEPIYGCFDLAGLTLFQRYLIQWIELENRAMDYLQRFDMHDRCLTLHTPQDLNDPQMAAAILDFVGADHGDEVALPGAQNRSHPGFETILGGDALRECREVVEALPASYLEIFRSEPYRGRPWAALLTGSPQSPHIPGCTDSGQARPLGQHDDPQHAGAGDQDPPAVCTQPPVRP